MKKISKALMLFTIGIVLLLSSCSKDDEATTIVTPPTNTAPEIKAQSFNVSETAANTDVFGMVKATDADKDELSYSITANSDDVFEITKAGALSLVAGKTLDFETKTTHEITVEVTDGKAKASAKITITVIDVDENMPPVITAQSFTIAENSSFNTIVGSVVASDPDNDNLTYTMTNLAGAVAEFEMTGNEIKLKSGFLDYETLTSHTATVTVNDGTFTTSAQVTITVTNVNEAPVFGNSSTTFTAAENIAETVVIGTLSAIDPEADAVSYRLANNVHSDNFEIDVNTGEISLKSRGSLDFETRTSYSFQAHVSDGTLNATPVTVTINITNVSDVNVESILALNKQQTGIVVDASGNIYVADTRKDRILKYFSSGGTTVLAGSGVAGFADGPGITAQFDNPNGLAIDTAGNIYVADTGNHRIRKITPAGVVSTIAGSGISGFVNGTGTVAQFDSPYGIDVHTNGDIYVADTGNHSIRYINTAGVVYTHAGTGSSGLVNGNTTTAQFNEPIDVVIGLSTNLYIADASNHVIRQITDTGSVLTLAGSSQGYTDGVGTVAQFSSPYGVTRDTNGNIYVADKDNHRIRKITPAGVVSTYAGSGTMGLVNGNAAVAQFNESINLCIDGSGTIFVTDYNNDYIRKIFVQ
ncbi:sugar lactone lactonase YvrE [Aquimarina sp. EL_43]|uniref:NHL repeat-containing protein n=1 Tax=unclassified Aquimarina TaxID=2627091 RepID=UPI0018C9041B|nr:MULTISPECIES: NHL repeat-containing protein [unclassified Aquimarina]MBG6129079.1 sugar lactone lactonase YvrE [Aquimarina sp. EL_35]MBG6150144.1 sugar lactone lactonase YvrE [Aquimarina sp. EL_32]MBG6167171.1 sugar lactone lactonase YvrE [Aquimarina sp. EL_43]